MNRVLESSFFVCAVIVVAVVVDCSSNPAGCAIRSTSPASRLGVQCVCVCVLRALYSRIGWLAGARERERERGRE